MATGQEVDLLVPTDKRASTAQAKSVHRELNADKIVISGTDFMCSVKSQGRWFEFQYCQVAVVRPFSKTNKYLMDR